MKYSRALALPPDLYSLPVLPSFFFSFLFMFIQGEKHLPLELHSWDRVTTACPAKTLAIA